MCPAIGIVVSVVCVSVYVPLGASGHCLNMYMGVHVQAGYIWLHVWSYMGLCVFLGMSVQICVDMFTWACVYVRIYVHVWMCMFGCSSVCVYALEYIMDTHIDVPASICVCMYMCLSCTCVWCIYLCVGVRECTCVYGDMTSYVFIHICVCRGI